MSLLLLQNLWLFHSRPLNTVQGWVMCPKGSLLQWSSLCWEYLLPAAPQDQERMCCLLQAALDLSTSTKPFDSVTAAHLLALLLPLPHLSTALLHCAQNLDHFQLPPPLPSEGTTVLEANALAGKTWLAEFQLETPSSLIIMSQSGARLVIIRLL